VGDHRAALNASRAEWPAQPRSGGAIHQGRGIDPMNDLRLWRSNLPPELNKTADKILKLRERTCADIIKIGQLLTDAKARLEHGEWGEWLRNEFAWSQDTAERFMNVSEIYGDADSATLRKLDTPVRYLQTSSTCSATF
jgi:hypothetical protein